MQLAQRAIHRKIEEIEGRTGGAAKELEQDRRRGTESQCLDKRAKFASRLEGLGTRAPWLFGGGGGVGCERDAEVGCLYFFCFCFPTVWGARGLAKSV